MRPKGEVPFPEKSWLKRYIDSKRWYSIREDTLISEMKKALPDSWEYKVIMMKKGMSTLTKYAEYMWLEEPAYQDELDLSYYMTTIEWYEFNRIRKGLGLE